MTRRRSALLLASLALALLAGCAGSQYKDKSAAYTQEPGPEVKRWALYFPVEDADPAPVVALPPAAARPPATAVARVENEDLVDLGAADLEALGREVRREEEAAAELGEPLAIREGGVRTRAHTEKTYTKKESGKWAVAAERAAPGANLTDLRRAAAAMGARRLLVATFRGTGDGRRLVATLRETESGRELAHYPLGEPSLTLAVTALAREAARNRP